MLKFEVGNILCDLLLHNITTVHFSKEGKQLFVLDLKPTV